MKNILSGLILVSVIFGSLSLVAQEINEPFDSNDDPRGSMPMKESQVRDMLEGQGLERVVVDEVVQQLKKQPGTNQGGELRLAGVLTSNGSNGAFFVDNDNWNFDGNVLLNGRLAKIPKLFDVYYYDGGFKSALEYKWMWVFLPNGMKVSSLDGKVFGGKVFGRGLALGTSFHPHSPVYVEGGWVSDEAGLGNAYILTVGVGLVSFGWTSGLKEVNVGDKVVSRWVSLPLMVNFPKLVFSQKVLLPNNY